MLGHSSNAAEFSHSVCGRETSIEAKQRETDVATTVPHDIPSPRDSVLILTAITKRKRCTAFRRYMRRYMHAQRTTPVTPTVSSVLSRQATLFFILVHRATLRCERPPVSDYSTAE